MENQQRIKPRIPSGFLELLPKDQIVFNQIIEKIKKVYERFGFVPLETPAIEFTEVLLAKGGGETDKQIYRINKEGDDLSLHFDLTVPLARYVSEHYYDLTFPFRRYQIQKVWRGERAQKGRFREFYQCDIDVIGTENVLADAEIPSVIYEVFKTLNFGDFTIRINNRKVLNGFFKEFNLGNLSKDILRIVDKIEKQGREEVIKEMAQLNISEETIKKIISFIEIKGTNKAVISKLLELEIKDELFLEGVDELKVVCDAMEKFGIPESCFIVDLSIARGLDYYTGTVYETKLNAYPEIGSVCSGGRFDNLAEYYTEKKLPGVGISIGLSRLFFKLNEAGVIKSGQSTLTKVLVTQLEKELLPKCLEVADFLRKNDINTEIYLEKEKLNKQIKYADKLGIPNVILIGETESREEKITLKNMKTGEQKMLSFQGALIELEK